MMDNLRFEERPETVGVSAGCIIGILLLSDGERDSSMFARVIDGIEILNPEGLVCGIGCDDEIDPFL